MNQKTSKQNLLSHKASKKEPRTMAELLSQTGYQPQSLKRSQRVKGKVISFTPDELLVDLGSKSEGISYGKELSAVWDLVKDLKVGDEIEATVAIPENEAGYTVLSLRPQGSKKRWQILSDLKESGEKVKVKVVEFNRGGVIAEFSGLRGFLPSSQLDPVLASDPSKIIGEYLEIAVLEADEEGNKLIFSQKAAGVGDLSQKRAILEKINIGEKYKGVISAVMPFGVFVNLDVNGGVEGLVHVSELSWEKVEPQKQFKVGEKIEVLVTNVDLSNLKLSLSLKQLQKSPWDELIKNYTKDQEVSGIVSRLTNFGAFVKLPDGIEGLIHISKVPLELKLEEGQAVECLVESIDLKSRKIALVPILKRKPVVYR